MNEIRYFTRTGRPLGSEQFISDMEKKLQRRFTLKSPGEAKKGEGLNGKYGMCP